MEKKYLYILIIALGLGTIFGGVILFKNAPTVNPPVKETLPPEVFPETPELWVPREILVTGTEFKFNPPGISLKAGERVKIVFQNKGKIIHNLTIEELGIASETIPGGSQDSIEFVAPSSGNYTFYCSVGSHRVAGMEGTLIVQ